MENKKTVILTKIKIFKYPNIRNYEIKPFKIIHRRWEKMTLKANLLSIYTRKHTIKHF